MVFWVPAISHESFERAYREIGAAFCIPEITDENANIKQLVKEALSMDSRRDWLMIVDNTDDPSVLLRRLNCDLGDVRLHDYLPRSTRGKILFTTRSRKMAGELTPGASAASLLRRRWLSLSACMTLPGMRYTPTRHWSLRSPQSLRSSSSGQSLLRLTRLMQTPQTTLLGPEAGTDEPDCCLAMLTNIRQRAQSHSARLSNEVALVRCFIACPREHVD